MSEPTTHPTSGAPGTPWPCLADARRQRLPRLGLFLHPEDPATCIGSLAWADLPALQAVAPDWPGLAQALATGPAGRPSPRLGWPVAPTADAASAWALRLATWHQAWRAEGRIRAWRDEPFPWFGPAGEVRLTIERAAARFWGARTLGAHGNGYRVDAQGRPSHLWVARRAWDKPTDPGRLDNLVGGGVPLGQSPSEALRREAWEEAGLHLAERSAWACGSVLALDTDVPEGRQWEWLYVFDLPVPAGWVPVNQDGEVAEHHCLPVAEALALAAAGEMTTDAALATLDFACRHRVLDAHSLQTLAPRLARLRVPAAQARWHEPAWPEALFNFPETGPQSG